MKRLTLISLILALFVSFSSYAQQPGERRQRPVERKEWFKELRQYKHDFLTKELKLTKEQQESFFPSTMRWKAVYINCKSRHATLNTG